MLSALACTPLVRRLRDHCDCFVFEPGLGIRTGICYALEKTFVDASFDKNPLIRDSLPRMKDHLSTRLYWRVRIEDLESHELPSQDPDYVGPVQRIEAWCKANRYRMRIHDGRQEVYIFKYVKTPRELRQEAARNFHTNHD